MRYIIILSFLFQIAYADSPITSTSFFENHLNIKIVKEASLANGTINDTMLSFLSDTNNSLELKLALINALGWEHKNTNSKRFLDYILLKKGYFSDLVPSSSMTLMYYGTPNEQICYAYLKANENYFDLNEAFEMASRAKQNSKEFGIHFVYYLIKAQVLFAVDESEYATKLYSKLNEHQNYKNVFSKSTFKSIFNYFQP